jgi:flagellum-specific peptidoglycan hydrolase FlgJ
MTYKLNENLQLVQVKNRFRPLSIVLALLLVVGSLLYLFRKESIRIVYKVVYPITEETKDVELTEEAIVKCLHKHGCVLPNIAVAQAKLESSLAKSNVGKNAKNMFGIVHHKCKYVAGKYGVYAKYETYEDNIKCYIHIQDHYLQRINGVYASDPTYISKIKTMK